LQKFFCNDFAENFDECGNDPGPPRLMAGADAGAVVAMEIFIEQKIVPLLRIELKLFGTTENRSPWPAPARVAAQHAAVGLSWACLRRSPTGTGGKTPAFRSGS
jgi:hypothetical protein